MSRLRITGARLLDPASGRDELGSLDVEDGRIVALGREPAGVPDEVFEANGLWLAPGFVDLHTHLREPGQEYKEDIETGTRSAAAGGYTLVCCMANTDPVNDSPAVTEYIQRRARESGNVRVRVIAAATQGLRGEIMSEMAGLAAAGAVAFSDDGSVIMDAAVMRRVLEYARGIGRPVIAHCEDLNLRGAGVVHEGSHATCCGLPGSPGEAETVMVARDLELARLTGAHLHVAHVSAARSVELIREAKTAGVRVTAEVTPHHLFLTDEEIRGYDTNKKMAPPLRTARDREALRQGLADGTLDCIATDHAPHAHYEKDVEFVAAPFGVVGLETSLSIGLELVREDVLSPLALIDRMSTRPARVFGVGGGTLEPGAPADLVLVDPERSYKVEVSGLESRSKNSAFLGRELSGRALRTWVGGRIAFALDEEGSR
ncbi:MAG: dihydroorotase [Deltaproteobacteria bacterium]|nr:dihydroorotase [Deltaproteobacteria bacterium]